MNSSLTGILPNWSFQTWGALANPNQPFSHNLSRALPSPCSPIPSPQPPQTAVSNKKEAGPNRFHQAWSSLSSPASSTNCSRGFGLASTFVFFSKQLPSSSAKSSINTDLHFPPRFKGLVFKDLEHSTASQAPFHFVYVTDVSTELIKEGRQYRHICVYPAILLSWFSVASK